MFSWLWSSKPAQTGELEFKGYAITSEDPAKWSDFTVIPFTPKSFSATDVELRITHCGVCGSDIHTITAGWGAFERPLIVGHEIVGIVTRVGEKVKSIKPGDRVGIGAQIASCGECRACKTDNEQYCPDSIETYNQTYADGVRTMGGYSTAIRADERFVFPIPAGLSSADAASMFCAGLTVYSPLVRNGAGPGKKVGVVGIGGLGHYAILFAKALGAEVYAFSSSPSKVDDIKSMGADHIVVTDDEGKFAEKYKETLDLIISTRDSVQTMPLAAFLSMLWVGGKLVTVGLPDDPFPALSGMDFTSNAALFGGSNLGCKKEAMEMLHLAAKKGIKPWIEELPMRDCKKAVEGVKANKVRYRYVLSQDLI